MINKEFGVKQEKMPKTHKTPFFPKQFPKPLFTLRVFTLRVYLQTCRIVEELFIYRNFAI